MSTLDNVSSGSNQWVIGDTLYFNSLAHIFVRGDVEISGSRIKRIVPSRTSRLTDILPGHEIVCLPGLINADAGLVQGEWASHSHELALGGITTAGEFHRGLPDSDSFTDKSGVRRLIYVELGENPAESGNTGVDRQALEAFERAVNTDAFGTSTIFPAVAPGGLWSAASLLAIASSAERLRKRLCVRLCRTRQDADEYKQTRFFTEIGLLSYLSILTSETTIFGLSQVSRQDAAMLRESQANLVCAPEAMSESMIEHHGSTLWQKDRAVALSISREAIADLNRYASLIISSMALMHRSENVSHTCDALVDSLTHSAASALGIKGIGSIAPDMCADLCLFDRPADLCAGRDSLYFIKLLASGRPRHVLINGMPAVVNGAFAKELADA
jgi:cytosine/adenosine deaminase-related metal-dependent hydrolase